VGTLVNDPERSQRHGLGSLPQHQARLKAAALMSENQLLNRQSSTSGSIRIVLRATIWATDRSFASKRDDGQLGKVSQEGFV
jgi:hypothetical protein